MKLILVLACICAPIVHATTQCEACLDGICYTRSVIFENYELSGQIAIDRDGNIIYFHFENSHSNDFTGAFHLDDIKFHLVPNAGFTFAKTVDQSTHDVYLSAVRGIYKYNPETNATEIYGLQDKIIWHMQYTDKLYYTEFLTNGLYTYENKKSTAISALSSYQIDDFIVDKRGDIYFMSDFTVYRLRKGNTQASIFHDEIYSLTTDKNGAAYFIQPATRGIYKLDYKTDQLVEVGAFNSGTAFRTVFDSDNNLIYHDIISDKLYYLTPNYGRCRVTTKGSGKTRKQSVFLADADSNPLAHNLVDSA